MGSLAYMVSWVAVWIAYMMFLNPSRCTAAFGVLIVGFFTQLTTDEKERNAQVRARLMDVAKAGDRQHMQPMIEAIRREFK